ncbi:hypothetical protein Y1Q_0003151 [Alligator mississippiensis]|uniref:Uncharacterized protein n=1 Tax=Alligator mississippiensis TaxID=8496 RepID=A0A151MDR0_ALLMI|nr:hypothetical protein Y1Q_0003151 [Alligator mississippiensis]
MEQLDNEDHVAHHTLLQRQAEAQEMQIQERHVVVEEEQCDVAAASDEDNWCIIVMVLALVVSVTMPSILALVPADSWQPATGPPQAPPQ